MTFLQIYTRMLYLIGETDTGEVTDVHKSHINAFVQDITNAFPFSWDLATADLTLSSGTADLPSDFNPNWHLSDARITGSSSNDDYIFTEIDPKNRDSFDSDSHVCWVTYDTSTSNYIFNTLTQTGTVTIYYYFKPATMTSDSDVCVVPDGEAVAYGAAAKNWVGDERNEGLQKNYEQEASSRVQRMYNSDVSFGPMVTRSSIVSLNPQLTNQSVSDLQIEKP